MRRIHQYENHKRAFLIEDTADANALRKVGDRAVRRTEDEGEGEAVALWPQVRAVAGRE